MLENASDVMDLLASRYGKPGFILNEAQPGPHFFDLNTGLAGKLFQKFTNYNTRLGLIVEDRTRYSKHFQALAREHDCHPTIRFFCRFGIGANLAV